MGGQEDDAKIKRPLPQRWNNSLHHYCLLKKSINTCADCLPASMINSSKVGPASPLALSEIARTTANGTSK